MRVKRTRRLNPPSSAVNSCADYWPHIHLAKGICTGQISPPLFISVALHWDYSQVHSKIAQDLKKIIYMHKHKIYVYVLYTTYTYIYNITCYIHAIHTHIYTSIYINKNECVSHTPISWKTKLFAFYQPCLIFKMWLQKIFISTCLF